MNIRNVNTLKMVENKRMENIAGGTREKFICLPEIAK